MKRKYDDDWVNKCISVETPVIISLFSDRVGLPLHKIMSQLHPVMDFNL